MGLLRPLIMFHVSRSRPLIAVVKQCARLGMAMLLLVASAPAGTGVAYARSITRDSLGPYKDKVLTIPSMYFVTILVGAVLPTCVAAHSLCGRQQPHCDGSMRLRPVGWVLHLLSPGSPRGDLIGKGFLSFKLLG